MDRMDLYLRRVRHPQARESYRVIVKLHGEEVEIGSIGPQFGAWRCGIDTAIPMRDAVSQGDGTGLSDCMKQFKPHGRRSRPTRPI